jgi:hypothetical protein
VPRDFSELNRFAVSASHWMLNRGMLRSREGGVTVPLTHHVHRFDLTELERALVETHKRLRVRDHARSDVELLTYFNALGDAEARVRHNDAAGS